MQNKATRPRGFTMIETLVVLGIVLLGIAILAPAVQQSHAQVKRKICELNLKMIGLGMHNYHEVMNTFPPGWVAHNSLPENGPSYGWQSSILMMLDKADLMDQIDFNEPMPAMENLGHHLQTVIDIYRCPADSMSGVNPIRGNYGSSNYSGNHGDQSLPRWVADRRGVSWPGQVETPRTPNGIFYWNSSVREINVKDGLAGTIFVGERSITSAAGIWPGVGSNDLENDAVTDCSHLSRMNQSPTAFSSRHPGGAYFLMGDGSVHFISHLIDSRPSSDKELGVYQRLANRHDGSPVKDF